MKTWEDTVRTLSEDEKLFLDEMEQKLVRGNRELQAFISYKVGAEYAWWKDGTLYVGNCGTTLDEALKEFGIN